MSEPELHGQPNVITLYSLGHSNHPLEHFIGLLHQHGVWAAADVRSIPYSRRNPQFNREPLARGLVEEGLRYVYLGDALGGKRLGLPEGARQSPRSGAGLPSEERFEKGLRALLLLAAEAPTCFFCAEENPHRCHRHHLVSPALAARGVRVWHIRGDGGLDEFRVDPEKEEPQLNMW